MKASVAESGANLDISPVLLNNSLDSVEAEAVPSPTPLVVKKGSKMWGYATREFGAVIADLDNNAIVIAVGSDAVHLVHASRQSHCEIIAGRSG